MLVMDSRKPYETPKWWTGNQDRQAMCCARCGSRDHSYEQCPQRDFSAVTPAPDAAGTEPG